MRTFLTGLESEGADRAALPLRIAPRTRWELATSTTCLRLTELRTG